MEVRRCASVPSDVVCLFGWVFVVARNSLRQLREERSLDCRDHVLRNLWKASLGNGVDAGMVLNWFGEGIGCGGEDATVWDSGWPSEHY